MSSAERRDRDVDGVSRIERRFCEQYIINGRNGELAYLQAGYGPSGARYRAKHLLEEPRIQRCIAELEAEAVKRTQLDIDYVLRQAFTRSTFDVTEIFQIVVRCCRYCHGTNNMYQRTHAEMTRDVEAFSKGLRYVNGYMERIPRDLRHLPFDPMGGDGYDPLAAPADDCPECHGRGEWWDPQIVIKPTEKMSAAARMMLAGIAVKGNKLIPTLRDQDVATNQLLATFRDMWVLQQSGGVPTVELKPHGSGSEQLRLTRVERVLIEAEDIGRDNEDTDSEGIRTAAEAGEI
jgi:phage terminase small subunit